MTETSMMRGLLAAAALLGSTVLIPAAMAGDGPQTEGFPRHRDRVERSAPRAQVPPTPPQTDGQTAYYCANPPGYYPSVPACATGWQVLPRRPGS